MIHCVAAGEIPEGALVTATMTGHGLKDSDTAIRVAGFEPIVASANKEAVMAVMVIYGLTAFITAVAVVRRV